MKNSIENGMPGQDYEDYTKDLSFLKQLEIPLLVRVLKEHASKEHSPLGAEDQR